MIKNLSQKLKNKNYLFLSAIFLLALIFRLYKLGDIPYDPHEDEILNAYIGRFILDNGVDIHGNKWPLFYVDKFGDYPPVLPMYISGFFTYIFGNNEYASRFPIAIAGALSIIIFYFFVDNITGRKNISVVSAFLLAISPWHILYSRSTAEGILATFFFLLGYLFFYKSLIDVNKRKLLFVLGLSFLLLTYFLYPAFRILTPLSLLPLLLHVSLKKQKFKIVSSFIFLIFITFLISQTKWGNARFKQTSLFYSQGMRTTIDNKIEGLNADEGENNILNARIFNNKGIVYMREFLRQYLSYFSPTRLFLDGGEPIQYYAVQEQGLLYISFLPLILVGAIYSLKYITRKQLVLFIFLLATSPFPAALTVDFTPHFHRSILLLFFLLIFASIGFEKVKELKFRRFRLDLIVVLFIFLEMVYFWHYYSTHSNSNKPVFRRGAYKDMVSFLVENRNKYSSIVLPSKSGLAVYYLYYTGNFNKGFAGKFTHDGLKLAKIGKMEFIGEECPTKKIKLRDIKPNSLLIEDGDCKPIKKVTAIKLILRKDSTRAFRIYKI